ncbi:hypothetical protein L7F22_007558 [Adiantum nelumboides]|nr:hypothetical protein [Adiantum nelumboides]
MQCWQVQNKRFSAVFNLEDFKVSCDRTFKHLGAAVAKYREIQDNISNAGIKFYLSLQDAITDLKQRCSEYVTSRESQNRDMIEALQRQLAGFSFQENSSSMPYPTIGNQPQREPSPSSSQTSNHAYYTTGLPFSATQPQQGSLPQHNDVPQMSNHAYYTTGLPFSATQPQQGSLPQHNDVPKYTAHLPSQSALQHHYGPPPQHNEVPKFLGEPPPQTTPQHHLGPSPQHSDLSRYSGHPPPQFTPQHHLGSLAQSIDPARHPVHAPPPYYSPGSSQGVAPSYTVPPRPQVGSQHSYGQSQPPGPSYYSPGPSQGVAPSYTVPPLPQPGSQQSSGWQAPYYNNAPPANVQQPRGPSRPPYSYQTPPSTAQYYQPSHGSYYR